MSLTRLMATLVAGGGEAAGRFGEARQNQATEMASLVAEATDRMIARRLAMTTSTDHHTSNQPTAR